MDRKDEGDRVSACRSMIIPGNAGKGRPRKRWKDVLEDYLKNGRLDRGLAKDKDRWKAQINYWENVRPVRARKKRRKMRREREKCVKKSAK